MDSIKAAFQGLGERNAELLQGVVISESPLKIQAVNDSKLIITETSAIVPWHLTDHKTEISFDDPTIKNQVSVGHRTPEALAALIESPDTPAEKAEDVILNGELTFDEKVKHKITVYNALKAGDCVHILAIQNGKKYFILDRVCNLQGR